MTFYISLLTSILHKMFMSFPLNSSGCLNDEMCKWLRVGAVSWAEKAGKRKWPTLIYPGCSLVWLVPSEHLAASHSLPLSPHDHRSPMSFLQGHKYFPQTPYCFHIILQTPPNDNETQTMHPLSCDGRASPRSQAFYSGWRRYTDTSSGKFPRLCI